MKIISLTRGYEAFVDDEDYERVTAAGPWHAFRSGNDVYGAHHTLPRGTKEMLHRFILGMTDPKIFIDHRNRYALDNRRENLRVTTKSQNAANSRKRKDGITSRFKGVCWHKGAGKFQAQIQVHGKRIHLGLFTDEVSAARAYDVAAHEHFGEFAKRNIGKKRSEL